MDSHEEKVYQAVRQVYSTNINVDCITKYIYQFLDTRKGSQE